MFTGHIIYLCVQVVLAKEAAIPYASLALVTDYDCWKDDEDCSVRNINSFDVDVIDERSMIQ